MYYLNILPYPINNFSIMNVFLCHNYVMKLPYLIIYPYPINKSAKDGSSQRSVHLMLNNNNNSIFKYSVFHKTLPCICIQMVMEYNGLYRAQNRLNAQSFIKQGESPYNISLIFQKTVYRKILSFAMCLRQHIGVLYLLQNLDVKGKRKGNYVL